MEAALVIAADTGRVRGFCRPRLMPVQYEHIARAAGNAIVSEIRLMVKHPLHPSQEGIAQSYYLLKRWPIPRKESKKILLETNQQGRNYMVKYVNPPIY